MSHIQPLNELKTRSHVDRAAALVALIESGPSTTPPAISVGEYLVVPDELVDYLVEFEKRREPKNDSSVPLDLRLWLHPTIGLVAAVFAWSAVDFAIQALWR